MADDADMRAVLREHGYKPSARGRLSPHWVKTYRDITSAQASPADDDSGEAWDGPDDDADIITGVIPADTGDIGEDTEPAPLAAERKPRRVKTASPGPSITDRILGRKPGTKPKTGRGKVKHARVPVDRFIGRMWTTAARLVAPVSQPAARAFALEAPIAGLLLEDIIRNTVVDRALQPAVRAEEKAERVIALTPPIIVLAIERAQGLDEPRRSMQLAILFSMLEEALTLQVQFAGERMAEAQERMAASEAVRAQVQAMIMQIFPPAEVQGQAEQNGQAGAPEFNFQPSET